MTPVDPNAGQIAQSIQLAVAPVFLLSAVGIVLTVLTNRLARVIDRARKLEDTAAGASGTDLRDRQEQLRTLGRRARLMNRAITMSVVCALLVSCVVVAIFVNEFVEMNLSTVIAGLFIAGMLSFIAALLLFLREVFLAIGALKLGPKR
jgi:MFS family permease